MIDRLKHSSKFQLIFIALLAILCYANTLGHDLVLDDTSAISQNVLVKKGISGIPEIWTHSYLYGYSLQNTESYRPVSLTLFAVLYQINGQSPTLYHLLQIILYALLGFALLAYLRSLLRDYPWWLPLVIASLFVVHPIHTEVVANVKSADEILGMLFGVLALHFALRGSDENSWQKSALAAVMYFLALTSKESAITLLVLFPFQIWFFRTEFKSSLKYSSIVILPLLIYFAIRLSVLEEIAFTENDFKLGPYNNSLLASQSPKEKIATAFTILGYYIKLIFVPHPLSYDYSLNTFPLVGWGSWKAILSLLIYISLGALSIWGIVKKKAWTFGIILYLAVLSIYSNLVVDIAATAGERFLFTPLLGAILAITIALYQNEKSRKYLETGWSKYVFAILLLVFGFSTVNRNRDWKNEKTLFLKDVQTVPNSFKAHLFAANAYFKPGEGGEINATAASLTKGIRHLKQAYKLYPDYDETYLQLAQAYRSSGQWKNMLTVCNAGLGKFPERTELLFLQGEAYMNSASLALARSSFLTLVNSSDSVHRYSSYYNLGACYLNDQIADSAAIWFEKAIELNPDEKTPHYYLGMAYFSIEQFESALQNYAMIEESSPYFAHCQSSMGTIYLIQEDYDLALEHLKLALLSVPGDENILNNMAVAYSALGQEEKAQECIDQINSPDASPGLR